MDAWQPLLDHQQGRATRAQLLAAALPRRLLTVQLRRVGPGAYCDRPLPPRGEHLLSAGVPDEAYVGEVREALLLLGHGAPAVRRTAAVLHGLDMQVEPTALELDVPRGRARAVRTGWDVRSTRRASACLWTPLPGLAPVLVTPVVPTVLDCAAELPVAQAVAIADSALRRGRCTLRQLRAGLQARPGLGARAQLHAVLRWVDTSSGSVLESLLRVLLSAAGLVPPCTQLVLRDPCTGRVQRVDFAWPEQRLVVEADGRRWHDPQDQRDADRGRDNTCARLGWLVLRFTWADVVHRPGQVVDTVRVALRSADDRRSA